VRALLQRVTQAEVEVDGERVGAIERGLLVLLGVAPHDDEAAAERTADKVAKLRIFDDSDGRMNLDVAAASGALLVVSQFTLYADTRRGNRPGFTGAALPDLAEPLYEAFCSRLRDRGLSVAQGRFGATMAVRLVNDGPVTIWLDSDAP
jgi:D-tyrosyl-tRNA(Tyr) deacylase